MASMGQKPQCTNAKSNFEGSKGPARNDDRRAQPEPNYCDPNDASRNATVEDQGRKATDD